MLDRFLRLQILRSPPEGQTGATPVEPEVEPIVEPEISDEPEPSPPSTPASTVPMDVFQRRVAALTRQKDDLARQLEAARATAQAVEPQIATVQPPSPPRAGDLHTEALALAAQIHLNERADAIARSGQELAPDFMTRIYTLNSTIGVMPPTFIEAVAEAAGDDVTAAKLLYDLAGDVGRAAEIISMSPVKQAVTLAKLAATPKVKGTETTSKTAPPTPIAPKVGGGRVTPGAVDLTDAKTSIDDWMAQRNMTARRRRG